MIAALTLLTPTIVYAQTADPVADKTVVDKVMHDYFEAYNQEFAAYPAELVAPPRQQ